MTNETSFSKSFKTAVFWSGMIGLVKYFLILNVNQDIPIIIFLIGIVASSLSVGYIGGLLSVLFSYLINIYLDTNPTTNHLSSSEIYLRLILLTIEGVAIVLIIERMRQARFREIEKSHKLVIRETELEIVHQRIYSILESISDAFFAIDNHWRFTYINNRAEAFFGRKREVLINKNIWKVLPELTDTQLFRQTKISIKEKKAIHYETFSKPYRTWLDVHIYPSRQGLSVYFNDISHRKDLEQKKEELIGVVSHELKTPITSIKAFAQLLKRRLVKKSDQTNIQILEKMDLQLNKLTRFINDLLDSSRLQSGKIKFFPTLFNFSDLINEIIKDISASNPTYKLIYTGPNDLPVHHDRDRLGQVITNLCTNAVKYSPDNKHIDIKTAISQNHLTLFVTDHGIGIAKDVQHHLFTKFFRADNVNYIQGVGLGLYISAGIIKLMRGQISVESELGKGSTFSFTIPLNYPPK